MRAIYLIAFIVLGAASLLWLRARDSAPLPPPEPIAAPIIDKRPPVFSTRRFDPAAPPPDMPSLHAGEQAQCDSNFMSGALVSGQTHRRGVSTAALTITGVKMKLGLTTTIWVPDGVTQKVLEHEEGHRQISEFFYRDADKLAGRVAASYIGREYKVSSSNLRASANDMLQQVGDEITAEYIRQLDSAPAQLRYDAITDHARNDVLVSDAIAQALNK